MTTRSTTPAPTYLPPEPEKQTTSPPSFVKKKEDFETPPPPGTTKATRPSRPTPAPQPTTKKPFRGPSYLPLPKISTEKPKPYVERTYTYGTFPTFTTRTWRHITGTPGTYTYR